VDSPLLEVRGLELRFDGVIAVDGVDLLVERHEICGLIGPNGAGKTSLFNCISRFYRPQAGSIRFDGNEILDQPAHRLAHLGVARTFQELALFPTMSVRENVELATFPRTRAGWIQGALRTASSRREQLQASVWVDDLLALLGLVDVADRPVPSLPYGTRKRIELARALAGRPRLLLLDEPASGLAPAELAPFVDLLRRVRAELGLTVLLIEHQMPLVMNLCRRVVVLDHGRVLTEGTPAEITASPLVQSTYLGTPV
jgi:branched-chain amino acid transport system ATP-binding protein